VLLSKEVIITADWSSVKRYEDLGYGKMRQGDKFMVDVNHLKANSTVMVDVRCDYCGLELKRKYSEYTRNTKIQGKFSCLKCTNNKYKETCILKYGVCNMSKLKSTQDKIKETSMLRYGVSSFSKLEIFKEQHKINMLDKYGVDSFSKTEEWLLKQKLTSLKKFGTENASQNPKIFSKQQKGRFEIFKFRDTDLFYQGKFELDFLNKYFEIFEIMNGPVIEYVYDSSNRRYFSDFYLPQFNLIVEVKSTYTYELAKDKNIQKQKSCLSFGYKHLFIIDKNYQEFEIFTRKI